MQLEQMLQPRSLRLDSLKLLNYICWFLENQIANITSQIIGRPSTMQCSQEESTAIPTTLCGGSF